MTKNMQELNQIGIGTSDPKVPTPDGGTNTPTDERTKRCIPFTDICIDVGFPDVIGSPGDLIPGSIAVAIEDTVRQWFLRVTLLLVGAGLLFLGLRSIT